MRLWFDRPAAVFDFGEPLAFTVRVKAEESVAAIRISMSVFSSDGAVVGTAFGPELDGLAAGEERNFAVRLPLRLVAGLYFCGIAVGCGTHHTSLVEYDVLSETLFFEVAPEETHAGAIVKWHSERGHVAFAGLSVRAI
jgi:hypothetical protein